MSVTAKIVQAADETFSKAEDSLCFGASIKSEAINNREQMRWEELLVTSAGARGKIDPFDQSTIHDQFKRDEIEAQYIEVHTPSEGTAGTVKESIVLKLQNDWLAVAERDLHLRKRSRIRLEAHSASRASGIGSDEGSVKNGLDRYISLMVAVEA
jgi:hypothetical protein